MSHPQNERPTTTAFDDVLPTPFHLSEVCFHFNHAVALVADAGYSTNAEVVGQQLSLLE